MLKSLKSRYIISAGLLIILIIMVLSWASYEVSYSSELSLQNANNRRIIQLTSSEIRDNIWELDFYINAYLLTPSAEHRGKAESEFKDDG